MATFVTIQRVRTYMEIVDQICKSIREGQLLPGEKLPAERTLAGEFGTGRQCLREALSVMEVLGVIEVRKGRGTFITQNALQNLMSAHLTAEELGDPFQLMEARMLLEPKVAGLAAKHGDGATLQKLEAILEDMKRCLASGNHPTDQDKNFHMTIAHGSGNMVLSKLVRELIGNMGKPLWVGFKERSLLVCGRDERYLAEHTGIAAAIKERNATLATRRMREHLQGVAQDVLK